MRYFIKIFSFAKPYKLQIALSLLCSFIFVIMNTASLWMISSLLSTILNPNKANSTLNISSSKSSIITYFEDFTNNILGNGDDIERLKILCIMMLIIFLLKNIFYYLSNITINYVNHKMIMDIRNKIFSHIQCLPLSFFHNSKIGEISSITIGDAARMRAAVNDTVNKLSKHPLNVLAMLIMLGLINMKMTLLSLIIIPCIGIVVIKIGQSIRRKTIRSSKQIAGVTNTLHQNLSGINVVKSFIQEKNEINKFKKETKKHFNLIYKKSRLKSMTTPINDMIGVVIAICLLWIGGREVFIYNTLDPDGFIKFIVYLFAMLQPAKKLASINLSIQSSIAAAQRVFSILNIKPQEDRKDAIEIKDFNNEVSYNNVNFAYEETNIDVLSNINLSIPKGKVYAIVGKSGSGKSTLINLLLRFYEISNGEILIDNQSIRDIKISSLRNIIGIVSQQTFLFNDTVRNNIAYGNEQANEEEIIKASKLANADEFIADLSKEYDTIIGERGAKLSGGQIQRISIARALLKNPPILIFDEATSSLDTESENEVKNAIDNLLEDRTVIIIAHRLSTITNADKIIVLDKGEIVDLGSHEELIIKNGKYKKLFDAQFGDENA
tara:strand:- start:3135 stop:4961 length:1827 start_codon:yes stop_codon:yes gene_type:complete